MNASEPDPLDVIVSDLRLFYEDNSPVELRWRDDGAPSIGYIAAIEDNYVVLARLSQFAWRNGFIAARFTAIHEVLPLDDPDEEFIALAMKAQGEVLPPQLPVRAPTLEGLLTIICAHFPMIIAATGTAENATDAGGTILRVEDNTARMRLLSRTGQWIEEEHELDLSRVTEVWFGSNYERVMERIGAYLDGSGG